VRRRIVLGAALALAGVTALAACSSSGSSGGSTASTSTGNGSGAFAGQIGSVPAEATGTEHAGTITVASPPNSAPTWILPVVPGANNTAYVNSEFIWQMYRPLYWLTNGVEPTETPSMSLANEPTWSNGDKTVTFSLKANYKWSNGKPVTAQDVLFWYYLVKAAVKESPANYSQYAPGTGLPDAVASISAPSASTVTMTLKAAVNPQWFLDDELYFLIPMPSSSWDIDATGGKPVTDWATNPADALKIYNYLTAQSKSVSTFATNPLWQVVDGPYQLTSFSATTGGFTMKPNPSYGGPHATTESNFQVLPYKSDPAEYDAVKSGSVDVGYVPLADVPQIGAATSTYNDFGYPDWGFALEVYNFKDTTGDFNNVIDKLYIRQALAHLENQPGYIKAFFSGAGAQGYGPVPSVPKSPFSPANAAANPYPFSTADAASLLKANGWSVVPNGTDSCVKPGTGAGECGAGIPAGTKLEWNVIYGTNPAVLGEQTQDWASEAKTVGITMNLATGNLNTMTQMYNDPASPSDDSKWAVEDFGAFTDNAYPTTLTLFNTTGTNNLGEYSDPQADKLIAASTTGSNVSAVTSELQYLIAQQPALFQPEPDSALGTAAVVVWKKTVSGTPQSFEGLTQTIYNPEFWFLTQ
jgi:peptide/nickel transport system substrate-binding protein